MSLGIAMTTSLRRRAAVFEIFDMLVVALRNVREAIDCIHCLDRPLCQHIHPSRQGTDGCGVECTLLYQLHDLVIVRLL